MSQIHEITMQQLMLHEYVHMAMVYHALFETKKHNLPLTHARVVSADETFLTNLFHLSQGNAMLMVGVFGPKYPCEEVFIKHIGNNQYNVQYVRIHRFPFF